MTIADIDALIARLQMLPEGDIDAAVYLTRDVIVLARNVFGESSPHLEEISTVTFRPIGVIYNEGHYMNEAAWKDGRKRLGAILKSMRYEASLRSRPELLPPEKITLPWLFRHLSWQTWVSMAVAAGGVFGIGFLCGRINLFVQIYNLMTQGKSP